MNNLPWKLRLPNREEALEGRSRATPIQHRHYVTDHDLLPPYPGHLQVATFGMGCFWGAERLYWQLNGVWVTAVGYAGGYTQNPTYDEVCSGRTGHTEVVRVVYDPGTVSYATLLRYFWEGHDPTQGMRQGNDVGTQYRSVVIVPDADTLALAVASRAAYQTALSAAGYGPVTTEITSAPVFYFAEEYHQQYLAKNPGGYCGIGGTRVPCPPENVWPEISGEASV